MKIHLNWFIYLLLVGGLSSCTPNYQQVGELRKKEPDQLRVVTYNVNWGKDGDVTITAPKKTCEAIRDTAGDIVLVQESTLFWQQYFKKEFAERYPYQLFKSQDHAGGFSVLSRFPVTTLHYQHSHIGWHPAWILRVNSPYGVIQVANIHLNPPLISEKKPHFALVPYFYTPQKRLKEIKYYLKLLKPNIPTVLAGDFNEDNNGWVTQFLNQNGFRDTRIKENQNEMTWHWSLGFIPFKRRLDHIFVNNFLSIMHSQVIYSGDSDHYPLEADLVIHH